MTEYHVPVMLQECIEGLNIKPDGIYVDVTFGGGGHSKAILNQLGPHGKLVAFDQDPDAKRNLPDDARLIFIDQNFAFARNHLAYQELLPVNGLLADLGVSSHQFDENSRGFMFRDDDAPLDMRMNPTHGISAADLLNTLNEQQLTTLFSLYGEIKNARMVARSIIQFRSLSPIRTAGDLKKATEKAAPKFKEFKFWAQVFQAIRIEVNQEMQVLKDLLNQCADIIASEGRIVFMSYHSLEDRMVKNFINTGNVEGKTQKDFYGNVIRPFEPVTRQAVIAGDEELEQNNRARSAKLRIAVKSN